jgi:hypothetical protein
LNDFELRSGAQDRFGPMRLLHNVAVEFDRDARRIQVELA